MKLTTREVTLLSRMARRVDRRQVTTGQCWFELQCASIGLDSDRTIKMLANHGLIKRSSKSNFWPVSIMISRD